MSTETIQRVISENADSCTIGSPGQGQIKFYFESANIEDAKKRAENAVEILKYAKSLYDKQED